MYKSYKIPWCEYITVQLFCLGRHLESFHYAAVTKTVALNSHLHNFFAHMDEIFWGLYLCMELL